MLDSSLLFACVLVNTGLIGRYLLPLLLEQLLGLRHEFQRSHRYLRCRLSEIREKAFRQRTIRLLRRLLLTIGVILASFVSYAPSMLLARYQLRLADAFISIEALGGMLCAALMLLLLRGKS